MQSSIINKGNKNMSNYTETMVQKIRNAAPLNLAKAQELASDFGNVTYRSVIAKAKSLDIEYIKAAPAAKSVKVRGPTKNDILSGIRSSLSLADREGDLTKDELVIIFEHLA